MPLVVVKADSSGLIKIVNDDHARIVYDLENATQIELNVGSVVPLEGEILEMMKATKLILEQDGPIKLGEGVRAFGSGPASFEGGVPDPSSKTLDDIIGLMAVKESSFRKRYDAYIANPRDEEVGKTNNPRSDPEIGVNRDILMHRAKKKRARGGAGRRVNSRVWVPEVETVIPQLNTAGGSAEALAGSPPPASAVGQSQGMGIGTPSESWYSEELHITRAQLAVYPGGAQPRAV